MKTEEIIEGIEKLSVFELVELKKALEERWGVTAAAPVVAAAGAPAAAAATLPGVSAGGRPARAKAVAWRYP